MVGLEPTTAHLRRGRKPCFVLSSSIVYCRTLPRLTPMSRVFGLFLLLCSTSISRRFTPRFLCLCEPDVSQIPASSHNCHCRCSLYPAARLAVCMPVRHDAVLPCIVTYRRATAALNTGAAPAVKYRPPAPCSCKHRAKMLEDNYGSCVHTLCVPQ